MDKELQNKLDEILKKLDKIEWLLLLGEQPKDLIGKIVTTGGDIPTEEFST